MRHSVLAGLGGKACVYEYIYIYASLIMPGLMMLHASRLPGIHVIDIP